MVATIEQAIQKQIDPLTRNESADKIKYAWSAAVENSPQYTNFIREYGADAYLEGFNMVDVHEDHREWIVEALSSDKVLNLADQLASAARDAGGPVDAPWRDE